MQGLRTQENSKFEIFFSAVQDAAKKDGKIFFLDAGDGNEFINGEMEGEDLLGWLVPEKQVGEFEVAFKEFADLSAWDDFYVSVSCNLGDSLEVAFS